MAAGRPAALQRRGPSAPAVEGGKVWYGSNELWTWLHADGTWEMARGERGLFDKSFWWRQGYDWRTEATPGLRVIGRRLDAPAPAVTISGATNGFEESMGAFMLVGLELPAGGAAGSSPAITTAGACAWWSG
jgi:hypothetical protein